MNQFDIRITRAISSSQCIRHYIAGPLPMAFAAAAVAAVAVAATLRKTNAGPNGIRSHHSQYTEVNGSHAHNSPDKRWSDQPSLMSHTCPLLSPTDSQLWLLQYGNSDTLFRISTRVRLTVLSLPYHLSVKERHPDLRNSYWRDELKTLDDTWPKRMKISEFRKVGFSSGSAPAIAKLKRWIDRATIPGEKFGSMYFVWIDKHLNLVWPPGKTSISELQASTENALADALIPPRSAQR